MTSDRQLSRLDLCLFLLNVDLSSVCLLEISLLTMISNVNVAYDDFDVELCLNIEH
jgi:hypothetical protein